MPGQHYPFSTEAPGEETADHTACGRTVTDASDTIVAPCQMRNNRTRRVPGAFADRCVQVLGNLYMILIYLI